jgi:hypothetical protein
MALSDSTALSIRTSVCNKTLETLVSLGIARDETTESLLLAACLDARNETLARFVLETCDSTLGCDIVLGLNEYLVCMLKLYAVLARLY